MNMKKIIFKYLMLISYNPWLLACIPAFVSFVSVMVYMYAG